MITFRVIWDGQKHRPTSKIKVNKQHKNNTFLLKWHQFFLFMIYLFKKISFTAQVEHELYKLFPINCAGRLFMLLAQMQTFFW